MASNERLYPANKAPSPSQPPRAGSNAIQVHLREVLAAKAHRTRAMLLDMHGLFSRRTRPPNSISHPTPCVEVFPSDLLRLQQIAGECVEVTLYSIGCIIRYKLAESAITYRTS